RYAQTPPIVAKSTWTALIPETSCAVRADNPSSGGMYNNIGYLTIDPPIPTIPEINEPMKPTKNSTTINMRLYSILDFPFLKKTGFPELEPPKPTIDLTPEKPYNSTPSVMLF